MNETARLMSGSAGMAAQKITPPGPCGESGGEQLPSTIVAPGAASQSAIRVASVVCRRCPARLQRTVYSPRSMPAPLSRTGAASSWSFDERGEVGARVFEIVDPVEVVLVPRKIVGRNGHPCGRTFAPRPAGRPTWRPPLNASDSMLPMEYRGDDSGQRCRRTKFRTRGPFRSSSTTPREAGVGEVPRRRSYPEDTPVYSKDDAGR